MKSIKQIIAALALVLFCGSIAHSQAVGDMGGVFNVNEMGAATYTLPFDLPAGINGMQPSLGLVYNSQSGNGVAGMGISVYGISAITRVAKDIFHDGTAKGISYTDNDVYSIDGVRIIQLAQNDYRPENSPADYITKNGTGTSQYFVLKMQNGNTAYYGQTSDAKANAGVPYAWYLNKMVDAHGNTITYTYTTYNNCVYLSEVTYGVNTVSFTYEDRSDAMPYIKRLKSVSISTYLTSCYNYTMTYSNTDAFSRLTKVEESYGSAELPAVTLAKLPAVTLGWSTISACNVGATNLGTGKDIYKYGTNGQIYLNGDINGDGIDDVIQIKKNSSNSLISIYSAPSFSRIANDVSVSITNGDFLLGDMDGDGINELLAIKPVATTSSDAISSKTSNCIRTVSVATGNMPLVTSGCVYNNGKCDVICLNKSKSTNGYLCKILSLNGTSCQTSTVYLSLNSEPKNILLLDVNGNGMDDLLVVHSSGYSIFWNQGVKFGSNPFSSQSVFNKSNINHDIVETGDFNGDGLLDLVAHNNNSTSWTCYINDGNGSFSARCSCSIQSSATDDVRCNVFDMDADGKDDLFISNITGRKYYWYLSKNNVLSIYKSVSRTSSLKDVTILSGDFNGDGISELANIGYDLTSSSTATESINCFIYYNNSLKQNSNKLTNVSTANCGISTSIAYSTLCDNSIYTKGSGSSAPVVDIQIPLCVVKQTTQNISAQSYVTNYTYKGLRAHLQGRGLLGFTTVTASNTRTGETRTTTVNSWNSTFFEPSKVTNTVTLDGKTSKTETTFATIVNYGKCHFTYPQTIKQTDIYGDVTTTTNTYNTGGYYLTRQRTEYGSSSMYKQVEYSSFVKVGGAYQPQTIVTTQKHSDDASAFSQTTTMTYNSTTGDITKKVANAGTMPLTHQYTYDSYGNMLADNVSGSGVTSVTTFYTYDRTHRFVQTERSSANSFVTSYEYNNLGRLTSKSEGFSSGSMLTTSYSYDDVGNLKQTIYPDGTSTTITRGWGTAQYKRYYVTTSTTGQASVTTYYDDLDREVSSSTTGEKDVSISSATSYDVKSGKLSVSTSKVGSISLSDSYTYNNLGQLTKVAYGTGKTVTYTYSKRNKSYSYGGRFGYQNYDSWGNVTYSSENGATSVTYKYSSNGQPSSINYSDAESQSFNAATMAYNSAGMQTSLTDVDAGKTSYEYDALGRVIKQTDAKGNVTTNTYNASGLIASTNCGGVVTLYTYDSKLRLTEERTESQSVAYTYDNYDRLTKKTYTIDYTTLTFSYVYNTNGQLASKTFPDGMTENYTYDSYGNLTCIKMGSTRVWELSAYSGTSRTAYLGTAPLTLSKSYSTNGLLTGTSIKKSSSTLHSFTYAFDGATGNLKSRTGMQSGTESFAYDLFDRLTTGTTYRLSGNIASKTGLGNYTYDASKKHAVTQVASSTGLVSRTASLTYNAFNKVSKVALGTNTLTITYGPTRQRCKTVLENGSNTTTTLYADNYEQRTVNGTVSTYHYVNSPDGLVAIYVKQGSGAMTPYYVETDHLGSICRIYDANGNQKFSAAYDPWGKQTVNTNTLGITRGYCAHEHWNQFGLIDMNGRFYDPVVGRFLSPDPYVQDPGNPQNFNRYSYCLNNPLKYTDPSGNLFDNVGIQGNGDEQTGGRRWISSVTGNLCGINSHGEPVVFANLPSSLSSWSRSSAADVAAFNSHNSSFTQSITRSVSGDLSRSASGQSISGGGSSQNARSSNGYLPVEFKYNDKASRSGKPTINPNLKKVKVPSAIASTATTVGANISNVVGAAAETAVFDARNLSAAKQAIQGINAIKNISKGAVGVGTVCTIATVAVEWSTGQFNTHSVVDIGVCIVGLACIGTAAVFSAPAVALGAAIGGVTYGIASICGLGTTIDKATNNWGETMYYKKKKSSRP